MSSGYHGLGRPSLPTCQCLGNRETIRREERRSGEVAKEPTFPMRELDPSISKRRDGNRREQLFRLSVRIRLLTVIEPDNFRNAPFLDGVHLPSQSNTTAFHRSFGSRNLQFENDAVPDDYRVQ
jgi:hypothetical protein